MVVALVVDVGGPIRQTDVSTRSFRPSRLAVTTNAAHRRTMVTAAMTVTQKPRDVCTEGRCEAIVTKGASAAAP